jgi:hypothetical protein
MGRLGRFLLTGRQKIKIGIEDEHARLNFARWRRALSVNGKKFLEDMLAGLE